MLTFLEALICKMNEEGIYLMAEIKETNKSAGAPTQHTYYYCYTWAPHQPMKPSILISSELILTEFHFFLDQFLCSTLRIPFQSID